MALSRERLTSLTRAACERPGIDPSAGAGAPPVRSMPAWVARYHVLPDAHRGYWLLCEPQPMPDDIFPSQMVLDTPPGRYMVDTFDATDGTCVAKESAEGGRLVAGLAWTGHPGLVHIYPSGASPWHDDTVQAR
jgi:hypothetical protein